PRAVPPEDDDADRRDRELLADEAPDAEAVERHGNADDAAGADADDRALGEIGEVEMPLEDRLVDADEGGAERQRRQPAQHRGELGLVEQRRDPIGAAHHDEDEGGGDRDVRPERRRVMVLLDLLPLDDGVGEALVEEELDEADEDEGEADEPEIARRDDAREDEEDEEGDAFAAAIFDQRPEDAARGLGLQRHAQEISEMRRVGSGGGADRVTCRKRGGGGIPSALDRLQAAPQLADDLAVTPRRVEVAPLLRILGEVVELGLDAGVEHA